MNLKRLYKPENNQTELYQKIYKDDKNDERLSLIFDKNTNGKWYVKDIYKGGDKYTVYGYLLIYGNGSSIDSNDDSYHYENVRIYNIKTGNLLYECFREDDGVKVPYDEIAENKGDKYHWHTNIDRKTGKVRQHPQLFKFKDIKNVNIIKTSKLDEIKEEYYKVALDDNDTKTMKLSDIIEISDEDLEISKIEFNTFAGGPKEEPFINRWLKRLTKEKRKNGECYGGRCAFFTGLSRHNFKAGNIVFSTIRIQDDYYLLTTVGIAKDDELNTFSKFDILDEYRDYFGKLIIEKPKGLGQLFTFNLKRLIDKINVITILDNIYDGKAIVWEDTTKINKNSIAKINNEYKKIKTHNKQQEYLDKLTKEELIEIAKQAGSDKPLRKTTEAKQYNTDNRIFKAVLKLADGICQLCNKPAPFNKKDGSPYLEVHHIVPRADGGVDRLYNCIALCPNCHRKMHIVEDKNDITKLKEIANNQVK